MVLPLYLAMTPWEMEDAAALPRHVGYFHPDGGMLPDRLPPGAMLVLTDRQPWQDPARIVEAVKKLDCGSVLLDFERSPDKHGRTVADALFEALRGPVAAPPDFSGNSSRPVFLPPCPLHVPLADYLKPWQGRAVWLEAALQQQTITVTRDGTRYGPVTPADREDGTFHEILLCRCVTDISEDAVRFTLFDTPQTLQQKLNHAAKLGVTAAVGLYQELHDKFQFIEQFTTALQTTHVIARPEGPWQSPGTMFDFA